MGSKYEQFCNKVNTIMKMSGNGVVDNNKIIRTINAPIGRYPMETNPDGEVEQMIVNIYMAYNRHKGESLNGISLQFLKDINGEAGYGIWETIGYIREGSLLISSAITKDPNELLNIKDELYSLSTITHRADKAVAYFCYIVDKMPFYQCNIETAFICMDRLLMGTNYSFSASDDEIDELGELVWKVWESGDVNDLWNYVRNKLIYKSDMINSVEV